MQSGGNAKEGEVARTSPITSSRSEFEARFPCYSTFLLACVRMCRVHDTPEANPLILLELKPLRKLLFQKNSRAKIFILPISHYYIL
ncbi:hypothetical protein HZH68_014377 [Vespula germanica]|uniref:Uncharacterized protein n=1 Tax=Vespula germanica TaxID=30212 RepID=A0A834MTL5_VESGE|nr:hypothetical protein HZH68_014377 [Vespula germanica]